MKLPHLIRLLFLLALPLSFNTQGSASTLQGKVVEVLDGERITVISVNQPIKIKLMGIAAPEKNQPFADVATQHLSQLVAGKFVVVQAKRLEQDGALLGQVMLNNVDLGAQMVRDGVAWYNKLEAGDLSEQDRAAYLSCEQAARSEARGIWQDAAPIAPWEFRRQQTARRNIESSPLTMMARASSADGRSRLSNDLFYPTTGKDRLAGRRRAGADPGWKTLSPRGSRFSVLVPGNSYDAGSTFPTRNGKMADVNYSVGQRGKYSYVVFWGKGPTPELRDDQVADDTAKGLVSGLELARNKYESDVKFEVKRQHPVKLGPYAGWQYAISGPRTVGLIRVFTRQRGQERELYVLGVLNGTEDDPQVLEFLGSLTIDKY
jgi:endonuclease YncB( thermonuclease family)